MMGVQPQTNCNSKFGGIFRFYIMFMLKSTKIHLVEHCDFHMLLNDRRSY